MHIFTETTTSDESWAVSWERRRSQCIQSYSFPNILLEGLKLIPLKKGSLMVHTLKKVSAARSTAKLLHIFSRHALRTEQHGLYTSNLLPTPMCCSVQLYYSAYVVRRTTDDECTCHATLAACYQLVQSVLKKGGLRGGDWA